MVSICVTRGYIPTWFGATALMKIFILTMLVAAFSYTPLAKAQRLVADLSSKEVAITTGFTGAQLLLFGATEGYGDVVIKVVGPRRDEIVRRKQRVAGMWVNGKSIIFNDAPAYYWMSASKALDKIASPAVLNRLQLGLKRLKLSSNSRDSINEIVNFRKALIRNKKRLNLYSRDVSDIKLVRGVLFRSTVPFPANVPIGEYLATVYLFKNGELVREDTTPVTVKKAGLEAKIFNFAHEQAPWYGATAILIALIAGWLAGVVFRKA